MFGMISASMPNAANTSTRNRDGTTLRSTARSVARAIAERLQMVGRLAAAVVQHDRLARAAARSARRAAARAGTSKYDAENTCTTSARAQLAKQQRQVGQLGRSRPQVLDLDAASASGAGGNRVDRHEPGVDVGIAVPRANSRSACTA